MLAPLAVATFATAAPHHAKGCHTRSCDARVGRAWWRRHHRARPASTTTTMVASYFSGGPGACGGGSWGVASKTLPCGMKLRICAANCVEVAVTDRGPYIAGRDLDLTKAVAKAVGSAPWEGGFSMSAGYGTVRVGFE